MGCTKSRVQFKGYGYVRPNNESSFDIQKCDVNSNPVLPNQPCNELNKGLITIPTTLQVQDLQAFANNFKLARSNYSDQFGPYEKDNQPFIHRLPPYEKIIRNDNLIQTPQAIPTGIYPVQVQSGYQSNVSAPLTMPVNNLTNFPKSLQNQQSLKRYSQNQPVNNNQIPLIIDFNNLIDNNGVIRQSKPNSYASSGMPKTYMRPINAL